MMDTSFKKTEIRVFVVEWVSWMSFRYKGDSTISISWARVYVCTSIQYTSLPASVIRLLVQPSWLAISCEKSWCASIISLQSQGDFFDLVPINKTMSVSNFCLH